MIMELLGWVLAGMVLMFMIFFAFFAALTTVYYIAERLGQAHIIDKWFGV